MIDSAIAEFGAIDILVNNAGIQYIGTDRRVPDAEMGRNHRGQPVVRLPYDCLALPAMKKKGWGRIVNMASAHALVTKRTNRLTSPPSMESRA